jgi:hypothetical protein
MSKRTADEKCLVRLYEQSKEVPSNESSWSLDELKTIFQQTERRTFTIVKMLAQANFVKKTREGEYLITPHGVQLVENLKGVLK